ncbi:MAG: hypothetical protein HY438_03810 [DPANN group archaeon]|nr:hypothetical protein [DPANN group archaeon]
MQNRKLGALLIGFGTVVGALSLFSIFDLGRQSIAYGCNPSMACQGVASSLGVSHVIVGLISALISLGAYLMFFSRSEEIVLQKLEETKEIKLGEEKFSVLLSALTEDEKKIVGLIKSEPGISQHMVTLKTGFSKAKVSGLMQNLEKRNLVKREDSGKTLSVYLTAAN